MYPYASSSMARRTVANLLPSVCSSNGWIKTSPLLSVRRGFSSTIFVSRLSSYTTDEHFQKLFSSFGTIKQVRLIRDKITGRPKGFGFIEYQSEAEAQKALKAMNCKILDGRIIFVEMARPEPVKNQSPNEES